MINFFDKLYTSVVYKSKFLSKIGYYGFLRFLIRVIANFIVPIYFRTTQYKKMNSLSVEIKKDQRIIVSLTSFPARINRLWIVIETLLRQKTKPDLIVLWLSIEQFSNLSLVPKSLIKLQNRGLKIVLCEDDLKSHKKYYYAMKEFPNDVIVTVDDDVIYNTNLLTHLVDLNKRYPMAICCNNVALIKVYNGNIYPYLYWKNIKTPQTPSFNLIPIGMGGILYPPNVMHNDIFNVEVFRKHCFYADDIWLNTMSRLNGTLVAKTAYNSVYLPVINFKNVTLHSKNVEENLNDKQLESIRGYYLMNRNIDPFKNILT